MQIEYTGPFNGYLIYVLLKGFPFFVILPGVVFTDVIFVITHSTKHAFASSLAFSFHNDQFRASFLFLHFPIVIATKQWSLKKRGLTLYELGVFTKSFEK